MSKLFKISVAAFALLALVAVGSKAVNAETWDFGTTTLKTGSSGTYVMNLQTALNTCASAGLTADGSFGPKTDAAVRAFQTAHALVADGLVGMNTKAALNSCGGVISGGTGSCPTGFTCAPTTPVACPTGFTCTPAGGSGTLTGGAGSVDDYTLLSEFNNEDVGEGEEDVEVMGFEVDLDDGSDLDFTSLKVSLENSDTTTSEDLDDFAGSVSVWFEGEEVGSADVEDFSSDDDGGVAGQDEWTKTIELSGAVCDAGETCEFSIAITALDNLNDGDIDADSWAVDVTSVRFEDGDGAVISEDPTFSATEFNFGTFAEASDIEMKVALSEDSPESAVIDVDDTDGTDNVELMKFTIEAEGSDLMINDIPVLLTVSQPSVTDDTDFVVNTLRLTVNGEEFTETVSTSVAAAATTITFDNLDISIDEGDEVEFTVSADFNDTQASEFVDGDTVKAELRSFEVDAIDADDQEGESVSDADATGTALGDAMALYGSGIMVTLKSVDEGTVSESTGANNDAGAFTIVFNVEAFDGTVYVSDTAVATTATDAVIAGSTATSISGIVYRVVQGSTATVDDLSASITYTDATDAPQSGNGNITLEDGESTDITLYIVRTNDDTGDAGIFQAFLGAVGWNTGDSATNYNNYYFDLSDFKTDPLYIN
jgi:hypothetical protein